VLTGEKPRHRRAATSEFAGEAMSVTTRWKIAVNRWGATYLLFDLETDPHETRNLAGDPEHRNTEDELRSLMLRGLIKTLS
jgi:arylsulfatase A-like enzyme